MNEKNCFIRKNNRKKVVKDYKTVLLQLRDYFFGSVGLIATLPFQMIATYQLAAKVITCSLFSFPQ